MSVVSSLRRQKSWQIADEIASLLAAVALDKEQLGAKLRELARARGLGSDEDAARLVGVSYRQYQRWLSGDSEPRASSLKLIAEKFGVQLGELLGQPDPSQLDRIEGHLEALYAMLTEPAGAARAAAALGARAVEAAGSTPPPAREPPVKRAAARRRKSA